VKLAEEIGYRGGAAELRAGGRAMEIVHQQATSSAISASGWKVSNDHRAADRYLTDAIEVDVDCSATARGSDRAHEHVEQAGRALGDSACCLPPHSLASHIERELKRQTAQLARALKGGRPDERAVRDPARHVNTCSK